MNETPRYEQRQETPAIREEFFPKTKSDWLRSQLLRGERGRDAVRGHVMEVYYVPLQKYFKATSFRTLGESHEFVAGFFASRLSKEDYLLRWEESELPLRRWLVNGFLFYLRESVRARTRAAHPSPPDAGQELAQRAESFEIDWARMIIRLSVDRARLECEKRGLIENWNLFEAHHLQARPYHELATERSIHPSRAAEQSRTAARYMRRAMLEILERDGVSDSEVEAEIARIRTIIRF